MYEIDCSGDLKQKFDFKLGAEQTLFPEHLEIFPKIVLWIELGDYKEFPVYID